jgi:hypothetical protein
LVSSEKGNDLVYPEKDDNQEDPEWACAEEPECEELEKGAVWAAGGSHPIMAVNSFRFDVYW